ncbi:UDP-glucose 4-epimerase [Bacillus cereus AH1272]|nr:UDP-glucose 4-epimerase [Bacillus cereus AH1272]EEL91067.1 UDP-glucose 4-epimerase [Bacillus cereus AH1273]
MKALEKVLGTTGIDAYNLGTGTGYSVLEMVEAFEKVSGKEVPYKTTERRPGDVAVCFADASKAKRELGWEALRGLEEMCADSWRWQSNNKYGYQNV